MRWLIGTVVVWLMWQRVRRSAPRAGAVDRSWREALAPLSPFEADVAG